MKGLKKFREHALIIKAISEHPMHIGQLFLIWVSVMFMTAASADTVSQQNEGRQLYLSYGCATCHGKNGDGRGSRETFHPKKYAPSFLQLPIRYLNNP
jgi:mono/diheme cytochrome c family protein